MNCSQTKQQLDDYLDKELAPSTRQEIEKHLASCHSCRAELDNAKLLLTALRTLPHDGPSPAQMNQTMQGVIAQGKRLEKSQTIWRISAMAAVICLLLSISLASSYFRQETSSNGTDLTISLYEHKTVSLLVDANQAMENAQITIELPSQLSLAGFADQRQISWHTDLKAGKNILQLPLIAEQQGHGTISTRIDHDNKNRTLRLATYIAGQV